MRVLQIMTNYLIPLPFQFHYLTTMQETKHTGEQTHTYPGEKSCIEEERVCMSPTKHKRHLACLRPADKHLNS